MHKLARGDTATTGLPELSAATHRWRQTEHTMLVIRWVGVAFALVQVLTYYRPYPPGMLVVALALVAALAVGNGAVAWALPRIHTLAAARRLGIGALLLDGAVVLGFVFVYTFDPDTAIWALIYVLPLEGAIRFQLTGALWTMAGATAVYTLREAFGTVAYGNDFLPESVSFRMGIGFIVAAVAGAMASNLVRQRDEAEAAKRAVEDYAAELAVVNAELQRADRLKDDFLAMANHELRTPLTTVVGYASLLADRWEALPDARRREFVTIVNQQARRLRALVEDVLTLSSLQAGALRLHIEVTEVATAVDEAVRNTLAPPDHVETACPPGLTVRADSTRLAQILTNYLSNALKYGAPPVGIEASDDGDAVEIRVRDHGPGVPEDFVPRLFEKFSRANGRPAEATGTGLGLAVVRLLAEAQGGRAWYEPGPQGSCFCVRLPAGAAAADGARS